MLTIMLIKQDEGNIQYVKPPLTALFEWHIMTDGEKYVEKCNSF